MIENNKFIIKLKAKLLEGDASLINLTNHSYFNLNSSNTHENVKMQILSNNICIHDQSLLPYKFEKLKNENLHE